MKDVELLQAYIKRRYKGKIDVFERFTSQWTNLTYNMIMKYGKRTVYLDVVDGTVAIRTAGTFLKVGPRQYEMHMADPDFELKLFYALDSLGMKLSKLKSDY